MPLVTLEQLDPEPALLELVNRLPERGLVLTTGQATSGKLTILLALLHRHAKGRDVVMLSSASEDRFDVFAPWPANWKLQEVAADPGS